MYGPKLGIRLVSGDRLLAVSNGLAKLLVCDVLDVASRFCDSGVEAVRTREGPMDLGRVCRVHVRTAAVPA